MLKSAVIVQTSRVILCRHSVCYVLIENMFKFRWAITNMTELPCSHVNSACNALDVLNLSLQMSVYVDKNSV